MDNSILSFDDLKDGERICSIDTGLELTAVFYDFYGTGEEIICFADDKSIWPATEFTPSDWYKLCEK